MIFAQTPSMRALAVACTAIIFCLSTANGAAGLKVEILSPKNKHVTQRQNSILVTGKVVSEAARSENVDIMFVIDISGSTVKYAGMDLQKYQLQGDAPAGESDAGYSPMGDLRNSVLEAEIGAARRVLEQLDAKTTRVGIVTFSAGAVVVQPLTQDFDAVRHGLDSVMAAGPHGGTNMVEGIRTGIVELMGLGASAKRPDAVKSQILLTDGFPTLPIESGGRAAPENTDLAINTARLAGKAGIKVHVFALGKEALSYTRAAEGIARESGGTYTPVSRAADVLALIDNVSVVGVDHVQIVNETTRQKAAQTRLASDGFFSAAVPVAEGSNQITVIARGSDGSVGRQSITVEYRSGNQKSLELEVFLERERKLQSQVDRLGKD